ncbi:DNA polymerase III subunit delta [Pseudanabaena sp. PCC 6802]|uniref:DNA polymerase III subunit delta n=1 Tax=Pseudanabaena sp. PCC 6802 TaxID=118173 RepID=UPI00034AFA40|nr:DNA polymerase III subunit delta [Pseudanabaena sp. PCC 6802]
MPTYFFWGEDEYQLAQAVQKLRSDLLDPAWLDFNYVKLSATNDIQIVDGLNQAATPPLGIGNRLTWLSETNIAQRCSEKVLAELERTLEHLPPNSYLLFTTPSKPDNRLKSTKLLQKYASIQEFSPIPAWNSNAIAQLIRRLAADLGLELTDDGVDLMVESVGSDSRRLVMEMEKLKLWHQGRSAPLNAKDIAPLVRSSAHNSLQLAGAIREGNTSRALSLLAELLSNNEAALKICATLTGQFRTWLWVKLMQESGERDDKVIAAAAEIGNPKRLYFLKQEVRFLTSDKLVRSLAILLRLEFSLKRGMDESAALQTALIELCTLLGKA